MKLNKDTALILLGIGLLTIMALFGRQCQKTRNAASKTETVIKDTSTLPIRLENARFKATNDKLSSENIALKENNERLEKRLKDIKPIYLTKYKEVKSNPLTDSSCMETLDLANGYINFQDSLIGGYSLQLANCLNAKENLNAQVKFNLDAATKCGKENSDCFVELSKFRHWIFRLYRKKR